MQQLHAMNTRRQRRDAGFTLVELMVVIAIIAALATIVGVNVLGALDEGDVANAQAQIRNLKTAVTSYRISFNKYPENLNALVNNPKKNFLDSNNLPKDPWGNDYVYKLENNRPVIISYGADGAPGGSGLDADISSANLAGDDS